MFELHECFINNENQIAQDAIFSFERRVIYITNANTNDEVLPIYNDKTLRLSQLVSDRLIQGVNQKKNEKLKCNKHQVRLGEREESKK